MTYRGKSETKKNLATVLKIIRMSWLPRTVIMPTKKRELRLDCLMVLSGRHRAGWWAARGGFSR